MTLEAVKTFVKGALTTLREKLQAWADGRFALKTELPSDYLKDEDVASLFNDVAYDSDGKKIQFKHDTSVVKELDATPFIKDGMVNTVSITDGKTGGANAGKKVLLITFNTDSGKEDIEIPLDGIFDASNYYNKTEADSTFVKNADWESKTADFLTEDDLEDYAKSDDVYSKTDADEKFVEASTLVAFTDEDWKAIMGETA